MDTQDIHMFVWCHQKVQQDSMLLLDMYIDQYLNYIRQEINIDFDNRMNNLLGYRCYLCWEHFHMFAFYHLKMIFIYFNVFKDHTSDWITVTTSTFITTKCISTKCIRVICTTWWIETFIDIDTCTINRLNNKIN